MNKQPKHPHRKLKKQERWSKRGFPRPTDKLCKSFRDCTDCPFLGIRCGVNNDDHAFHPLFPKH